MSAGVQARSAYGRQVGVRLREVRKARGDSLDATEKRSQGTWKATVVGSYERGSRSVTVDTLAGLADFYEVAVSDLLPEEDRPPLVGAAFTAITGAARVLVAEDRERVAAGIADALARYEDDMVFTAPEARPMRMAQLRERIAGVIAGEDS